MLFALMVLVIATFVVLWMFDVHKTLFVKARSRNAGDAAALAAARWQGATLNLLGELNLLQAVSLAQSYELRQLALALPEPPSPLVLAGLGQ